MIPEIGNLCLVVALLAALAQGTLPIVGAARNDDTLMRVARPAARLQFALVAAAFGCLAASFLGNDFSVLYVASNSNSALPAHYRFAAVWGSHEGSLLLWTFILSMWTLAVSFFSRSLPRETVARVLGVMGLVSVGFLLFMLFTSNPFARLLPAPANGRDLNPLLQDPGMVFHPPLLYMGYVGFCVAFAFAVAALIGGRLDATWARWSRPWTTIAWMFLTLGIALGSGWAYYELGWGGWWFWDPVENASFMPWLVGTALLHSLAVTEKRGCFRSWTVLLAIAAFSLSLLGTFLVRSGVLTSVHAFATDPKRGIFILTFLAAVIGSSLLLFAWRAPKIGLGERFDMVSRESMLLANNVLLVVAAGSVMLGTLYPLLLDALGLGKLSVGPPYFEAVFLPLMTPLAFLLGIGPLARWKSAQLPQLAVRLRWAAGISIATALIAPLAFDDWHWRVSLGLLLAFWIAAGVVVGLWKQIFGERGTVSGEQGDAPSRSRFRLPAYRSPSLAHWGMQLAHLGVAVFIVGVTLVKGYEAEKDVRMEVGDHVDIGGYRFLFKGVTNEPGPNYLAARGSFIVSRGGAPLREMNPEKRTYMASGQVQTEAAIDTGFARDLYVSLGEPVGGGAWSVRVYHKPFVDWIWGGCLLMALGGLLAMSDRRYRLRREVRAGVEKGAVDAGQGSPGAAHGAGPAAPALG